MASVLDRPTLVLNRNWQPVNVVSVARALTMVWKEAARIIDVNDYGCYSWEDWSSIKPDNDEAAIHSVSLSFKVPEVITLFRYSKSPPTTVSFSRRNIFKRDDNTCQYCGIKPGTEELTIDHVIPRAKGGQTTWENCVLACVDCNSRKEDKLLKNTDMKLLKTPVQPRWTPQFACKTIRVENWRKFLSDVYWNVPLE